MLDHLTQEEASQLLAATLLVIAGLFSLLTWYAVSYAKKALRELERLTGIKVSAENTEKVIAAVRWSIAYVKEQAEKYAAGKIKEGPRTGAEKLELAKSVARSIAPAALAEVSEQQLTIITEAELQILRPSLPPPVVVGDDALLVNAGPGMVPKLPPPPVFTMRDADTAKTPLPPRRTRS